MLWLLTRATPGRCSWAPGQMELDKEVCQRLLAAAAAAAGPLLCHSTTVCNNSQLHPLLSYVNCASARYAPSADNSNLLI